MNPVDVVLYYGIGANGQDGGYIYAAKGWGEQDGDLDPAWPDLPDYRLETADWTIPDPTSDRDRDARAHLRGSVSGRRRRFDDLLRHRLGVAVRHHDDGCSAYRFPVSLGATVGHASAPCGARPHLAIDHQGFIYIGDNDGVMKAIYPPFE